MKIKAIFKDYKPYRDFFLPEMVNRFIIMGLAMTLFSLVSIWIMTQTKIFDFASNINHAINLYSSAIFVFGGGAILAFIGKFLKTIIDSRRFYIYYFEVVITASILAFMKWASYATYISIMEGGQADYIIITIVQLGIGCFFIIEPVRYFILLAINFVFLFAGIPYYTGGTGIANSTKYNLVFFALLIWFWGLMKYIAGLKAFKAKRSSELGQLEKVQFLNNISFEVSSALQSLISKNDMMVRLLKDNSCYEDALDIKSQLKILNYLTEDISDMARIEADAMDISVNPYKTDRMLSDVSAVASAFIKGKGLEFKMLLSNSIPTVLRGDEQRLKQVIFRLLTNAVKYTQEGQITLSVDFIKGGPLDGVLVFVVSDTGVGIRDDEITDVQNKIFAITEDTDRNAPRTSLGLSLTARLVKALGGQMGISSVYNRGTDITVEIGQEIVSTTVIKQGDTDDDIDVIN